MNTLLRHSSLFLLVSIAGQGMAATSYTTPDGMWDIKSNSTVAITIGTNQRLKNLNNVYSQAQYYADKTYKSYDWQGIPATWKQSGNTYQTQVNTTSVNSSKTSPAYINRIVNTFTDSATQLYGTAPTVSAITLKSFLDTGTLDSNGRQLKGTLQSVVVITYKIPGTDQTTTSKLKLNGTYQATRASAPSNCCTSTDGAANQIKSQKFLENNAELPEIFTTSSGLQYKIIQKVGGANPKPLATDTVRVSYRGYLPSGQVFDANSGTSFPLNGVISGWTEGLQLMSVGDYYRFYIPAELAYGNRTVGTYIKPNTALLFDVILESIQ